MEAKKIKNRTQLLIYILVILGLLVVVNYLGTKWFERIDMTEGKEYSISASTKKILKNLDDIVNIKVYFSKNLPPNLTKVATDVKDILSNTKLIARISGLQEDPAENDARSMARSLVFPKFRCRREDKARVINGYLGILFLYEDKRNSSVVQIPNLNTT